MANYPDVLAAVRDYFAHDYDSFTEMGALTVEIEKKMGLWKPATITPVPFLRQVRRAVEVLIEAGDVVKVPRGGYYPSGAGPASIPAYYTKEDYARALENAADCREEQGRIWDRWRRVNDVLAAAGFTSTESAEKPAALSLEDWERLVTLIEVS